MGVFSSVPWYNCEGLHFAFLTAGTKSDVDTGDLEHHFLKGVCNFSQLVGYFE